MNTADSAILLELFLTLDTPEGLRAELVAGEILIGLPPTAITRTSSVT